MSSITVVLAADAAFRRQLAVVVSGISRFAAGSPHTVFVLHGGYDLELIHQVEQSAGPEVTLHWIEAQAPALPDGHLPARLPVATLFRLRITELLPSDVDRVIYLDTDVVLRSPLDELWNVDLGDSLVAAVRDPVLAWLGAPNNVDWRHFALAPELPYFNAGVLVLPLATWRAQGLGERVIELVTTNRFRDADQGALNVVVGGRWLPLAPTWNLQGGHLAADRCHASVVEAPDALDDAVRHPSIVHFNWGFWRRPWDGRGQSWQLPLHQMRGLWYDELDRTAWAGWRPDQAPPSAAARLKQRVDNARRALAGH